MKEKLKSLLHDDAVFYSSLFLMVGLASFGLGRQSALEEITPTHSDIEPLTEIQPLTRYSDSETLSGHVSKVVVASKSGTKYHLPTCPGAKQIKESNIVEFTSIQAAEAAGYTPAANCSF